MLSRICTCGICGKEELTHQTELPDGWIIMYYYGMTLCECCVKKWEDRWDQGPEYLLKGGEEIDLT